VIRLALRVRRAQAELVLAELLELAPAGVEEVDRGDVVEYAVYGAPGELPDLPALRAAAGGALVEVASSQVPADWERRWRRFHRPVLVADRLHVRPPWEPPLDRADVVDIVIDPARAFGTGAHPTTRLCLELLAGLEPAGSLLDLGCGSGVLGIAAARLGWSPVLAGDHEPAAVEATAANAAANGVEVEVRRLDLRRQPAPAASTVVANLTAPLLGELAGNLAEPVPERAIVSGLLARETAEALETFAARGLRQRGRREESGWAALLLSSA
jgi:ribosomal protein L11 methyltransferase